MATQAKIPDHVPPELVRSTGLGFGPEYLAEPYEFFAGLHEKVPPIFYSISPMGHGAWNAIGYEDVFNILRNPQNFITGQHVTFPRDPNNFFHLIPIEIDPPEHTKYRKILDPMLAPKAILALENDIRKLANDLIDEFIDDGEVEFTKAFGRPLPVLVFLKLLGLPLDMRDTFVEWAMGMLHSFDREVSARCMRETMDYLRGAIEEKKRNPDDGAVSAIVHGTANGEPLSEADVFGFVFFLFIAGLDTVFATLNNIFHWLALNPDDRHEIIAKPDQLLAQSEELIRRYGTTFSGRTALADIEIGGVKMKKGDKVTCILPSANLDPKVFTDPLDVQFGRQRRPNLSFTAGPHSCMGAHLARLEVKIALSEFLKRIPDFQLKAGTQIEYWPGGVVGPKLLPLVW